MRTKPTPTLLANWSGEINALANVVSNMCVHELSDPELLVVEDILLTIQSVSSSMRDYMKQEES